MEHASGTVNTPPRVFVSHAGEDRERFVRQFAERLRANGVAAWTSFWEINPGDSVVDKVFKEGLNNCQAFIVVLSDNSVTKPWVREELDAGMIRKIEQQTKLIAVRLDGCEVPECLKHIAWQDVPNIDNYDEAFQRILNGIFGFYEIPPVGTPPAYMRPRVLEIGDLTRVDSLIFEKACRIAIDGDSPVVGAAPLVAALAEKGVAESQIIETQEILDNRGYIELLRTWGPQKVESFRVTQFGFDQFVRVAVPEFDRICSDVARSLVWGGLTNHRGIAQDLDEPPFLIEHVFRLFGSQGLIKYVESHGGELHMEVYSVSAELKRNLQQN